MSSSPQEPQAPEIPAAQLAPTLQVRVPIEDPPWSGWDVVRICAMAFVLLVASVLVVAITAKQLIYPQTKFMTILTFPLINFTAQMLAYVLLLMYMVRTVKRRTAVGFWSAIRWNWPQNRWAALVLLGLLSYAALVGLSRLLPWPKKSPFEDFFKHPIDAYAVALLAITIGPLLEELLFRGFLYPVLARRMQMAAAVLFTAIPFALIHYPEYGSWSPVLIVFMIGVVVTMVRAKTGSVASSFIVHAVYNGIQMAIAFVATGGFRHLEKMTQ